MLWTGSVRRNDLGQVAKLLVLVRSALDLRFQVGKARQDRADECVGEVGLGRRVRHEKGEGEIKERRHAHCKHLSHACMCKVMKKCQKNVRATRSVCTPSVAHTAVATTWVRTSLPSGHEPLLLKKFFFFCIKNIIP